MPEAHSMAIAWLTRLSEAVSHANPGESLATLFTPSGVLRDSLVFSWDVRSLSGPPVIADHVSRGVETRGTLSDVRSEEIDGTRIFFTFRTALGAGRGSAELASDGQAQWMFLMLDKINGHAETLPKDSVKYRVDSTQAPYVVVVGAGQTGLTIAARLRRLGIPTLLFERTPRVGDSWRTRYDGLILNTPKEHHSLLYEPYPDSWPVYTPKDHLADWLEAYATSQDLVVWTSTSILTIPKYDPESHVWSITITRANHDRPITLRPAHLVLATSTLGPPYTPSIPDLDIFTGFSIHSSAFHGPEPYAGKRVLMVGAANTACDLARILAPMAASVTLLQRNPTCLILPDVSHAYWSAQYPPGLALEEADFRNSSPPGLVRSRRTKAWREAVLVDGGELDVASPEDARRKAILHAGGFRTWFGAHGEGALGEILSRFAGYLTDTGFSDALADGKIAVRAGSVANFTKDGVILDDGSTLQSDAVIFATGYSAPQDTWSAILGTDLVDAAGSGWGIDKEGEITGAFRRTRHPALWWATGDFAQVRWGSKQLGLLILAHHLEYV